MRKSIVISMVLMLIVSLTAFGQYRESTYTPGLRNSFIQPPSPGGFLNGLLDPSRMQMNQSYSMAYLSSGGDGFMQGMYLNNMRYQLSNPLILDLNLGYMHTPYNSYDGGFNGVGTGDFVGGLSLTYKPSKNVALQIGFNRMPYYYSPYSYNPYGGYSSGSFFNNFGINNDPADFRPKEFTPALDGN